MNIHVTPEAAHHLISTNRIRPNETALKLIYDTDGCGCAVNGIARLVPIPRTDLEEGEALTATSPVTVVYETRQEVFFEDELILDYLSDRRHYVLKSRNQYYNPTLIIE